MAYSIKGAPFRYKGAVNVEDCKTSEDVIEKAGLNWEVAKCEIVAKMPAHVDDMNRQDGFNYGGDFYSQLDNAYATYRTDHNIPLGLVKERYTPVQNMEAFRFFDNAIGKNAAIWQTAGFFGNGERIFVSAKLPDNIFVKGDPVENYLVFTTSHDGSSGVKILFTPIRVVCQNTLNAAIRGASNYVSFRHTNSVHERIDVAHEILGITKEMIKFTSEALNTLASKTVTDKQAMEAFASTILTDNELLNITNTGHTIEQIITRDWRAIDDSQISSKKVNVLNQMNTYYFQGIGQKENVGNAYGVLGAITGYYSNVDNATGAKRMDSILYGDKSRKIQYATELLLNI